MKKRPVIKRESLQTTPPLLATMVWGLMLDRFHAPGYVWGILGTIVFILWIAYFSLLFTEEVRDPFQDWGKK